jgi:hypothetical protein
MDIIINCWAVLACGVVAMVIGSLWYGPLFGKKWMQITGSDCDDAEKRKEMQKAAMPLYAVQFVLVLLQVYVLARYIKGWSDVSGVENALWVWVAFVMPTVAGSAMWTNNTSKMKWATFFLQAGYQLVLFVVFGVILSMWK